MMANVEIAVGLSDARKKSVELAIALVPGRDVSSCRLAGMRSLTSNLLRPVEFGSVDPHAMQNDRELTRDRNLGLAEPVALGELHPPGLHGGPFWNAGQ